MKQSKRAGLAPGTLVHVGRERTAAVKVRVIDYSEGQIEQREPKSIEESFPCRDKPTVTWINVDGIHHLDIIEKIGQHFGLHPLILEDVVNTAQRPKLEEYEDHFFLVLKMLSYDETKEETHAEQISIIIGKNFVISFQEVECDVFDPVRERIRNGKGRIRKIGADYLAYALADAIVDHNFIILEKPGERIEALEEETVANPDCETLTNIHRMKR